jgi:hypothetical protein
MFETKYLLNVSENTAHFMVHLNIIEKSSKVAFKWISDLPVQALAYLPVRWKDKKIRVTWGGATSTSSRTRGLLGSYATAALQTMGFPSVADPIDLTQNPPPSNLLIPQLVTGACSFEFQELDTNWGAVLELVVVLVLEEVVELVGKVRWVWRSVENSDEEHSGWGGGEAGRLRSRRLRDDEEAMRASQMHGRLHSTKCQVWF